MAGRSPAAGGDEGGALRVRRLGRETDLGKVDPVWLAGWDGAPPRHDTEVRLGHDGSVLWARFGCVFDRLHVDERAPRDRPVPRLWEHDVVEVFVAPRGEEGDYFEVEASPLGQWLALAFTAPRAPSARPWGARPVVDSAIGDGWFEVTLAIALDDLGLGGDAGSASPRIGLFRLAGTEPGRDHYALRPTLTAAPDFHVPGRWAELWLE